MAWLRYINRKQMVFTSRYRDSSILAGGDVVNADVDNVYE